MANKRIYDLTEDTTPSSGDFLATDKSGNVEATKVDVAKFAILAGQAGGQTLYGDTAANGDLILHGTSSATRTTSYVLLQPTAGNVGIGTTAPGTLLHINYSTVADSDVVKISNSVSDSTYIGIALSNASGQVAAIRTRYTNSVVNASSYLSLWTNVAAGTLTERMRIDGDGNVGIGTAAPGSALHIHRTGTGANVEMLRLAINTASAGDGTSIGFYEGTTTEVSRVASYEEGGGEGLTFWTRLSSTLSERVRIDKSGNVGIGNTSPDSLLHVSLSDSGTNTAAQVVTISHNGGTAAAGFGSRILWELESSTTDDQTAAALDVLWATATHGSRAARMVFSPYDTAAREALRLEASGSAAMIGFFGANAVVKPTGVTVDAAGIHAALVSLGLIAA